MLKSIGSTIIMIWECIVMSVDNIVGNKVRSFLTLLGIMIGVTAVIALISTVNGVTNSLSDSFMSFGVNTLTVSVTGTDVKSGVTPTDIESIIALDEVDGISPSVTSKAYLVYNGVRSEDRETVSGKSNYYFATTDDLLVRGRLLNSMDDEDRNWVCMIGSDVMEEFFFGVDPIGKTIYISGLPFEIVGIFNDDADSSMASTFSGSPAVLVPYTTALRLSFNNYITSFTAYISDGYTSDQAKTAITDVMNPMFGNEDDTFTITSMESVQEVMESMMGMMSAMLAGIASIALVVGGIGIMNMMLTTVTERTAEIGLKKALGAMPWQIQIQFLIESFMLSMMGGLIGVVLGIGLSFGLCSVLGAAFTLDWGAVALGVGFSAAVGILFGWAPARKASKLNPIDALRSM